MEERAIPVVRPAGVLRRITSRKGERKEAGSGTASGGQHHQLVRQTLQVVHQRAMLLLLLGHVTGDYVIHYS